MASVFIYNIHPKTTMRDLIMLSEDIGPIEDIKIFDEPHYRYSAMIDFMYYDDALDFIDAFNNRYLDGRQLRITLGN